ncbi:MAG: protoporphyrinogen oxidase HemJ [Gammaproteobacteria bacterium]|nr:protoporphyrinogen oxidase HemJ [Gammaproteobacteria bacterium]
MLIVKAFHIIAMVSWFAGLFYIPRLFVYHTQSKDKTSIARFKLMEKRLFYAIMCPAGVVTTALGAVLLTDAPNYYHHAEWMQIKLGLVVLLWFYHAYCGYCLHRFANDNNPHSTKFYRIFNEIPTLLLIVIVLLAVVKPT